MDPSALAAIVVAAGVGIWLGRVLARRQAEAWAAGVKQVVGAIGAAAAAERDETLRAGEINGREEARTLGAAREAGCQAREAQLDGARERLLQRTERLRLDEARLEVSREQQAALRQRAADREGEA